MMKVRQLPVSLAVPVRFVLVGNHLARFALLVMSTRMGAHSRVAIHAQPEIFAAADLRVLKLVL
jgi:hypothetical protein